jgi:biotin carboxylase
MLTQKRLLMLGGTYAQIPAIKCAKELGHYVITCDYLPENPGHKFADEYHNVSTTDREAVLRLAKELHIDGIVAYASDPAAPTAAYVAEKLHLPTNPYESVMILSRKDLFRAFLAENGFNVPKSQGFYDLNDAKKFFCRIKKPVMIKPADSSGSKGVRRITELKDFDDAFNYALTFSREKLVVVEEYIQRVGPQIMGDGFVVNGELVFTGFTDHQHDESCNPFVPTGGCFPSAQSKEIRTKAHRSIQRILSLLKWRNGALNIEYIVDEHGEIYILEIGPRNGGNFIPDMLRFATSVDLIKYTIDAALGIDCSSLTMQEPNGYYSYYVVHSRRSGILKEILFSDTIQKSILFYQPYMEPRSNVDVFNGANCSLGILILKFASREDMQEKMNNMERYISVILDES